MTELESNTRSMRTIVEIEWDEPREQTWLCADNISLALHAHCKSTRFVVRESQRVRRPEIAEVFRALIAKQDGFTLTESFRLKVANLLNRLDIEAQENAEREAALVAEREGNILARDALASEANTIRGQLANAEERAASLIAERDGLRALNAQNDATYTDLERWRQSQLNDAKLALAEAEERATALVAEIVGLRSALRDRDEERKAWREFADASRDFYLARIARLNTRLERQPPRAEEEEAFARSLLGIDAAHARLVALGEIESIGGER